jgi:hypothetical protein
VEIEAVFRLEHYVPLENRTLFMQTHTNFDLDVDSQKLIPIIALLLPATASK